MIPIHTPPAPLPAALSIAGSPTSKLFALCFYWSKIHDHFESKLLGELLDCSEIECLGAIEEARDRRPTYPSPLDQVFAVDPELAFPGSQLPVIHD